MANRLLLCLGILAFPVFLVGAFFFYLSKVLALFGHSLMGNFKTSDDIVASFWGIEINIEDQC